MTGGVRTAARRREYAGAPGADGQAYGPGLRTDAPTSGVAGATASDLDAAFATVGADLAVLADRLRVDGRAEEAGIAEAVTLIAADPELRAAVDAGVAGGLGPAAAVEAAIDGYAQLLADLPDPTLAARATDVRAVGRRLLAALRATGPDWPPTAMAGPPVVLVGYEVAADDLLVHGDRVAGVVSVVGGGTAHAAIVARAMGVPAVFGVPVDAVEVADGTPVVVDGTAGRIVVDPVPGEVDAAQAAAEAARRWRGAAADARGRPATTPDGYHVTLLGNVATAGDARNVVTAGGDGVGLLRTELAFLDVAAWPEYTRHCEVLIPVLAPLSGLPVSVRTLDFAPDKLPPFLAGTGHADAIGVGLELMLGAPDAFTAQLRAIVRAGHTTGARVRVLIPMVASAAQLAEVRALLDRAASAEGLPVPPLGAMIELPEAVADIDALASSADFLSIGSNDLSAVLLGRTRRDPRLGPVSAAEPPVLRAIHGVVEAGARHGTPVSLCGDAAAVPRLLPLWLGIGPLALSVAPAALDGTRALLRSLPVTACRATAARALAAHTLDDVLAAADAALADRS